MGADMSAGSGAMAGRTVLITGGTGGIGLATATALASMGARVGLVGRDESRANGAAERLRSTGAEVDVFTADLSAQREVRALAATVLEAYPRLDVLVNNVGGSWATRHVTEDGLERTFALNHLAPFLLTNLLIERLRASAPSRVVTVSSGAQAMGRIDFDDLQGERRYNGQRAYNQSKLANVMFTYELARRLEGSGVTANALHPGVVRTAFGQEDATLWMRLLMPVGRPFLKSPERGAETPVFLASAPELEGVTGRYFANRVAKASSRASYDVAAAQRLWEVSAQLVGLAPTAVSGAA
jgi:NAD(P)-dependent dehydrogenase (short-subunit alcohol dehydrogenase family)